VLLSGGLDSAVLAAEQAQSRRRVFPIYVRAGLIWEPEELKSVRRFLSRIRTPALQPLAVLELPMRDLLGQSWSTTGRGTPGYSASMSSNYIVGRNLTLLAKAAVFCARNMVGEIAIATLKENPFPDASADFFKEFARSASIGLGMRLKVSAPYSKLSKTQVVRRGKHLPLELTLSCARPVRGKHCGRCTKCAERQSAFREAKVSDRTRYAGKYRSS
jgi:7-cyano-7-deazaguanine synthase